jgi:hypothetical protein
MESAYLNTTAGKYRNYKTWGECTSNSYRYTAGDPLNIPIYIVLPKNFITTCFLPFPKCVQHTKKDEGDIRPGGFEPLLVFAVSFLSCFAVLDRLSVILTNLEVVVAGDLPEVGRPRGRK